MVNQRKPEAVILSIAEYTRLVEALQTEHLGVPRPLAELRRRWDEKLASLNEEGASDRLRSVMRTPGQLGGRVKAGLTC